MDNPYEGITCRELDALWCLAAINVLTIDEVQKLTAKVIEYRDSPGQILKQIGSRKEGKDE